jgi:hypothetical protein
MDSLNPFNSGFNPLSLLGGGGGLPGLDGLEGADPMQLLSSLFGNSGAAQQGQDAGQVCACGGSGESGACSCGSNCCQKNQDLGF